MAEVGNRAYRLPDKLNPFPDESLAGLAMRYAAIYRLESPVALFDRLSISRTKHLGQIVAMPPASELGNAVLSLLNVPGEMRAAMSPWHDDGRSTSVMGCCAPVEMVDTNIRRCCTSCLRQKAYHRAAWLVSALPACATHGGLLVDRCPAPGCGRSLRWRGPDVARCSDPGCNFDLRETAPERVRGSGQECLEGLARLLHGCPGKLRHS